MTCLTGYSVHILTTIDNCVCKGHCETVKRNIIKNACDVKCDFSRGSTLKQRLLKIQVICICICYVIVLAQILDL